MIVVVDYGVGNISSVLNMLKKIGAEAKVSKSVGDIVSADKFLLPGVGAFDAGMEKLTATGLIPILEEQVMSHKKPVLGICLGAQMLGRSSEEGSAPGLGWIDMEVKRFEPKPLRKIPHMGWNFVSKCKDHPMLEELDELSRFYFVHSYYMQPQNKEDILLTTNYEEVFVSAVARENIIGVQFHPEKSHKYGMQLLHNFAKKI